MTNTLYSSPVADVLARLFADAEKQAGEQRAAQANQAPTPEFKTPYERFLSYRNHYLPIDRPYGNLMYSLIRASQAKTVVEFGTSFGISTIFLAAALRDNGGGTVVTTEFIEDKIPTAKKNLSDAGLIDLVEFRFGDAIETLRRPMPGVIDFVFLDGEKSMYLDVLKVLEPGMRRGCLISSDNTDNERTGSLLDYVRDPANGYVSSAVLTPGGTKADSGHEISVRV